MKRYIKATAVYSIGHFAVDFSCAFFIFNKLHSTEHWILCLLIYNFFAFAMQMPLGLISDKTGNNSLFAIFGCALVAVSAFFGSAPIVLCVLAGLGNGMFHIGAGRDVLVNCDGRFSELGIFVSPGAVGLYIGALAGKTKALHAALPVCILLVTAFIILWIVPEQNRGRAVTKTPFYIEIGGAVSALMLLSLFLVVCLRSYVGMTLAFPWKSEGAWALALVIALALGKASGGILADRSGAIPVSIFSLSAGAILFLAYKTPVCGVLAVFFFNMTMPITLGAVARLLPGAKGFGFGLLTFGLFVGLIPVVLGLPVLIYLPWGFAAASLISCLLLCFGLKEPKHGN